MIMVLKAFSTNTVYIFEYQNEISIVGLLFLQKFSSLTKEFNSCSRGLVKPRLICKQRFFFFNLSLLTTNLMSFSK